VTCREIVELMTEYMEGTLSAADRERFESHIAGCEGCREYLAEMRFTRLAVGRLAQEPIPARVERELMQAFRDWRRL
jgi:anti-sigma factor RsiW